jgi:hypothetical protein
LTFCGTGVSGVLGGLGATNFTAFVAAGFAAFAALAPGASFLDAVPSVRPTRAAAFPSTVLVFFVAFFAIRPPLLSIVSFYTTPLRAAWICVEKDSAPDPVRIGC